MAEGYEICSEIRDAESSRASPNTVPAQVGNAQTLNGFQDRRFQPLSQGLLQVGANARATRDQPC